MNLSSHQSKFRLRNLLAGTFLVTSVIVSCSSDTDTLPDKTAKIKTDPITQRSVVDEAAATTTPYIAVGNTGLKLLEFYHYSDATWNSTTRLGSFKPTTALGFASGGVTAAGQRDFPVDMKVHYTTGFASTVSALAVVGHRWVGIAKHQDVEGHNVDPTKLWETWFSDADDPNIHGVELLSNGNVAVAGTGEYREGKGHWVRIYNTSNPAVMNSYAEISVQSPRCLLWDPANNVLWVGGVWNGNQHGVKAYTIGTRTNPQLVEVSSRTRVKTWPALKWPHEIQPYFGNTNKFWYADHTGLYIFDKTAPDAASAFTPAPGSANRAFLKSAGNQATSGYIIQTLADPVNCGTYCTKQVDFYGQTTGNYAFSRTVSSGGIYKARIWTRPYQ